MISAPPDWLTGGLPHIWQPYAQAQIAPTPLPVISAKGCSLTLADGRKLIDGVGSWWSVCHGYQHPQLVEAITKQAETLSHVMFAGLAHEPAYRLAERLTHIAPEGLTRVFFSDSGSTSVEVAMKMALQYWQNVGQPKKDRFICFSDGYHGDTFGAMSVTDPARSMHKAFKRSVIPQFVMDIPSDEYSFAEFETMLDGIKDEVAGMIIEPLVQGAGGMKFHSADTLAALHRMAKAHDILFIADEIATGFYRTGSQFACMEAGISPDMMCLSKALTGGMLGLGATLAAEQIFEAFLGETNDTALPHGPTFMANPMACAAANASLDLFEAQHMSMRIEQLEQQLTKGLMPLKSHEAVLDVRIKGGIGAVQLKPEYVNPGEQRLAFAEQGCWVRPFADVIYLWPAYVIQDDELAQLFRAIEHVLDSSS